MVGVTATASFHTDKTKRFRFADSWCNCIVIHAVVHEVLLRNRKISVLAAAVTGMFDLNAGYDAVGRHAQHPICR